MNVDKSKSNNKENPTLAEDEAVKKAEKKLQDRIKELSAIYKTSRTITSSINIDEIIDLILDSTFYIVKSDGCLMYLYYPSRNSFVLKAHKGIEKNSSLEKFLISNKDYLFKQKEIAARNKLYVINDISCLDQTLQSKLKKFNVRSYVSIPISRESKMMGLLVSFSGVPSFFNKDDIRVMKMFSHQAAIAIQNAKLLERTQVSYLNTVKALANIIEIKDASTYGHSERVMARALAIADTMGLSKREKKVLRFASFLHDIGKINIDVSILRKPSSLNSKEWKEIKKHPKIGAEIVEGIGFLEELAPIILHHHERYSGGGYPNAKLRKETIPLGARILAVADAYESMISDRPYRKALSKKEAIKELKSNAGTQFDPEVVNILLKMLEK